jgi:hypothetical protein
MPAWALLARIRATSLIEGKETETHKTHRRRAAAAPKAGKPALVLPVALPAKRDIRAPAQVRLASASRPRLNTLAARGIDGL